MNFVGAEISWEGETLTEMSYAKVSFDTRTAVLSYPTAYVQERSAPLQSCMKGSRRGRSVSPKASTTNSCTSRSGSALQTRTSAGQDRLLRGRSYSPPRPRPTHLHGQSGDHFPITTDNIQNCHHPSINIKRQSPHDLAVRHIRSQQKRHMEVTASKALRASVRYNHERLAAELLGFQDPFAVATDERDDDDEDMFSIFSWSAASDEGLGDSTSRTSNSRLTTRRGHSPSPQSVQSFSMPGIKETDKVSKDARKKATKERNKKSKKKKSTSSKSDKRRMRRKEEKENDDLGMSPRSTTNRCDASVFSMKSAPAKLSLGPAGSGEARTRDERRRKKKKSTTRCSSEPSKRRHRSTSRHKKTAQKSKKEEESESLDACWSYEKLESGELSLADNDPTSFADFRMFLG